MLLGRRKVLEPVHQCLGNFRIQKWKEDIASVEDVGLGAQRAEGAAVFSADHTDPDDRQNLGNAVQFQDRIGALLLQLPPPISLEINGVDVEYHRLRGTAALQKSEMEIAYLQRLSRTAQRPSLPLMDEHRGKWPNQSARRCSNTLRSMIQIPSPLHSAL